MHLTPRISLVCFLFIVFHHSVDAVIKIIDPHGRNVAELSDRMNVYNVLFGVGFKEMEGFIIMTEPEDACSSVEEPAFLTNFTYGRLALINGSSTCTTVKKVHHAEQAGFDFAIIYDDPVTGSYIYTVGAEPPIPAVFINFEDSLIIRNYSYNNRSINNYRIRVLPESPTTQFWVFLLAFLVGVCIFQLVYIGCRWSIRRISERIRRNQGTLSSSRQIRQLPTRKFCRGDQSDTCAICLYEYKVGDKLRILPCSHAYHVKCIDPWLKNNRRNCPLCKQKVRFGDSRDESESDDSPTETSPLLPPRVISRLLYMRSALFLADRLRELEITPEPSSPTDILPGSTPNSQYHSAQSSVTDMMEPEDLVPSTHFSVNNGKDEGEASSHVEVEIHFENPFERGNSPGHAESI